MINHQWLELPISRTNLHGPKDVRAIGSTVLRFLYDQPLFKKEINSFYSTGLLIMLTQWEDSFANLNVLSTYLIKILVVPSFWKTNIIPYTNSEGLDQTAHAQSGQCQHCSTALYNCHIEFTY